MNVEVLYTTCTWPKMENSISDMLPKCDAGRRSHIVPLQSVNSNATEKVLIRSYFYPFIFNQVKLSLYIYTVKVKHPITGLDRPTGLREVEDPSISRQSAHVNPTHRPTLPSRSYTGYSCLIGWVHPRAILRPEGSSQWTLYLVVSVADPMRNVS